MTKKETLKLDSCLKRFNKLRKNYNSNNCFFLLKKYLQGLEKGYVSHIQWSIMYTRVYFLSVDQKDWWFTPRTYLCISMTSVVEYQFLVYKIRLTRFIFFFFWHEGIYTGDIRDHSSITSASGWVQKMAILLIFSTVYADIRGWV